MNEASVAMAPHLVVLQFSLPKTNGCLDRIILQHLTLRLALKPEGHLKTPLPAHLTLQFASSLVANRIKIVVCLLSLSNPP